MAQRTEESSRAQSTERPEDDLLGQPVYVENLHKRFANGSIVANEDVNIEIQPDEFVVLLGPSGCGKTTALRCIAGLETPDEGRILIGDEDVTNYKPKDRDLAFVFQSIALFPHMSVRENMRFGLDMTTDLGGAEKEERVKEVAQVLGIEQYLDSKPANLSGGQQQRVSIGRAMIMEPEAFLLDEPFSNLDANLRDQLQTEIKKLQRELQRAMVFVTHDQAEAMTLADKIVIMKDGRIQQNGSPYDIYNDPENLFVASFIGSPSTNMIDCTVTEADGGLALTNDVFSIPLSEEQEQALSDYQGEDVQLGVRPEYVTLTDTGLFEAEITLIEPEGSHDTVHLSTDGMETLQASVQQGQIQPGGLTMVDFDRDMMWAFDRKGERLI